MNHVELMWTTICEYVPIRTDANYQKLNYAREERKENHHLHN